MIGGRGAAFAASMLSLAARAWSVSMVTKCFTCRRDGLAQVGTFRIQICLIRPAQPYLVYSTTHGGYIRLLNSLLALTQTQRSDYVDMCLPCPRKASLQCYKQVPDLVAHTE